MWGGGGTESGRQIGQTEGWGGREKGVGWGGVGRRG